MRAEELHRPVQKVKKTRKVYVGGLNHVLAADIVDYSQYSKENDNYKWILCAVDAFSRYAWAIPMGNKSAASTLAAVKQLFNDTGRTWKFFWTDDGKEFVNASMTAFLKTRGVVRYTSYGQHGSMLVERFNRTLKSKLAKIFTATHSNRWIDTLGDVVESYNNTRHRSIKMTPTEASKPENEQRLLDLQYKDAEKHLSPPPGESPLKIGNFVRLSRQKGTFEKGYTSKWSEEIYRVTSILHTNPRVYELADLLGEKILGAFYSVELQKTKQNPNGKFLISNIIDSKIQDTIPMKLVHFFGYGDKFDAWIPESKITFFPSVRQNKKNPHPIGEAVMFPDGWKPKRHFRV